MPRHEPADHARSPFVGRTIDDQPRFLKGPLVAALAVDAEAGSVLRPSIGVNRRRMGMKIWYQSMSRFETKWKSYPRYLRQILDRVKDPDTEIELHGITKIGGFADQYRYLEYLETGEVMENVHKAMAQKFDAFLIGNIADPGLRECREIANFPVLGLCETSLHVACMMGANFSLVTINEKFTPRIVENVHRYGLKDRLAAVNRMKVDRILNLDEGFENPEVQRDLIGQFQAAAKANTDAAPKW